MHRNTITFYITVYVGIVILTVGLIILADHHNEKVSTFLNNWMNGVVAGFLQVKMFFLIMSMVVMTKETLDYDG